MTAKPDFIRDADDKRAELARLPRPQPSHAEPGRQVYRRDVYDACRMLGVPVNADSAVLFSTDAEDMVIITVTEDRPRHEKRQVQRVPL